MTVSPNENDAASKKARRVATLALVVLSPVIAEVLSGATRLSFIFVLIPEIMVWGCGTLMIREFAVRRRLSWIGMLLLGIALAVSEEFLIQQTSIAPLPWPSPAAGYGRFAGVNWPYFVHMLGYEAVWVVLIPIQIVHLIWPEVRERSWLRTPGIVVSAVLFVLGSFVAWFTWTRIARKVAFHAPDYTPPATLLAAGLAAIVLLILLASRFAQRPKRSIRCPRPWAVGLMSCMLALPWWVMLVVVFVPVGYPPLVVVGLGVLWTVLTFFSVSRWTSSEGWSDLHRWAVGFSAVCVCMAMGYLGSASWSSIDLYAKIVMNVAAIVLLALLGKRVGRRGESPTGMSAVPVTE